MVDSLLFAYPGSKFRLAPLFAPHYPPHKCFVSLFGGSGAEIGAKEPSWMEVFNDRDDFITDTFAVLRNDEEYRTLQRWMRNTIPSRSLVDDCRNKLKHPERLARLEKTYAFLCCANLQYGANPVRGTLSTSRRTFRKTLSLPRRLAMYRKRFRSVLLENRDWRFVLSHYDSDDTFFFVDPPYHPGVLTGHPGSYYRYAMTSEDHAELLVSLERAKGKVLLCGYQHPMYTQHLFHWRRLEFERKMTMNTRGEKASQRQEQVWLNYEHDGTKIAGNKQAIAAGYLRLLGDDAWHYIDLAERTLKVKGTTGRQKTSGHSGQAWLKYGDDGSGDLRTKLLVAKRCLALLGKEARNQLRAAEGMCHPGLKA